MIGMLAQAALTALFVLVAIGIGIAACYRLLYPSKADEADETWKRTAVKETKAPPVADAKQAIVVVGETFADCTPSKRQAAARALVDRAIAAGNDPLLDQRIHTAKKPDDITLAKVKRIIKKGRK